MFCSGVIAEYNPFHNGHMHHLRETINIAGNPNVIAVMSGSFVQRGEPALFDKFTRTRMALKCGVSLVIELPCVFSLSSAEGFASGAVRLLNGSGMVKDLCFGSETPDLRAMESLANIEGKQQYDLDYEIRANLKKGQAYPRAFYEAAERLGIVREGVDVLSKPNSLLGVEYLRAIRAHAPMIKAHAIKRLACAHDEAELKDYISSASSIREEIGAGRLKNAVKRVPDVISDDLINAALAADMQRSSEILFRLLVYRLLSSENEKIARVADVGEGLENVLAISALSSSSYSEFLSMCKSKRYSLARIRRICMNALIGITREVKAAAMNGKTPLYLRVLGVRKDAMHVLSALSNQASIPVITRYRDADKLPGASQLLIKLDTMATSIRSLIFGGSAVREFSFPLIVV